MTSYTFIANSSLVQNERIKDLYAAEGWWDAEDDGDPALVPKIIEGSHCFVVAEKEGEIIGMGRAISDGVCDAYIQDVTVRAAERGRGIGRAIVERIVDRLKSDGIRWIGLVAARDSDGLYRKAGFDVMPAAVPMLIKKAL
jgi:ribosomal protein S18 acetylase RimI-like enzyme